MLEVAVLEVQGDVLYVECPDMVECGFIWDEKLAPAEQYKVCHNEFCPEN